MELNVLTNGSLQDGVIKINSGNFYLETSLPKDSEIKENVIANRENYIRKYSWENVAEKILNIIKNK